MHRIRFLAKVSAILNSSLNYQQTLKLIAELTTPQLADWCVVDILNKEAKLDRLAVSHIDPKKIRLAIEIGKKYIPNPSEELGPYAVIRSGKSELYTEIPEELLINSARNDEHRKITLELGFRSAIIVPINAHGKVFGTISFIYAESERRYDEDDLLIAEDLGRISGIAIFNAQLYEHSKELNKKLDEKVRDLQKSENRLKASLEASGTGTYTLYIKNFKPEFDDKLKEIFGISTVTDEIITNSILPEERDKVRKMIYHVIETGNDLYIEYRIKKPDGSVCWLLDKGKLYYDENGSPDFITGACVDITRRKLAEERMYERDLMLRQITENIRDIFFIIDPNNFKFIFVSPAFEEIFGIKANALYRDTSLFINSIHPDYLEKIQSNISSYSVKGSFNEEYKIIRGDGVVKWLRTRAYPINNEIGELIRIAGITEDITNYKDAEEKIKESLKEKEILLKEIHHRVKNNLQIISSLLSLQTGYLKDPDVINVIGESRDRVKAMALLHEKLYQNNNFSRIQIRNYIEDLAKYLIQTYSHSNKRFSYKINVVDEFVDMDLGISLGLILNELISNSLKHGLKNKNEGEIEISFCKTADNHFSLKVIDNGEGLPENFDLEKIDSLGLELVKSLVDQISGSLSILNGKGTEVEIRFRNKKL